METPPAPSRSPKYPHTRELLRIALEDGMTQEDVARLCRTQQSIVSAWANGKSKARKEVLAPLLRRYGHRVNRTAARVYLVQMEPACAWERTPRGALLARLRDDPRAYVMEHAAREERETFLRAQIRPRLTPEARARMETERASARAAGRSDPDFEWSDTDYEPITAEDLAKADEDTDWERAPVSIAALRALATEQGLRPQEGRFYPADFLAELDAAEWASRHQQVVRVEGPVLWRHTIGEPRIEKAKVGRHGEEPVYRMEPVARWVLHALGDGRFRLVAQRIRVLTGLDLTRWHQQRPSSDVPEHADRVLTDDDAARWLSTLHGPFDLPELLAHVAERLTRAGPHDRAVVPFTLRKALVEHGYDVPDVMHVSSL